MIEGAGAAAESAAVSGGPARAAGDGAPPRWASPSQRRLRLGAAILAGAMLAAAFPPLGWYPLAWLALTPLLWALSGSTPRQAAGRGYAAGLLFMGGVGLFTTSFGGGVFWMSLLPWVLFTAIEALWFIPVGLLLSAILRRGPLAVLAGVPAVWVLGEWARGAGPYGFPFGGLAITALSTPLVQLASIGGCYLVTFLVALGGGALYLLFTRKPSARSWGVGGLAAVVAAGWAGNGYRAITALDSHGGRLTVLIAQGNANAGWGSPVADEAFESLCRNTLQAGVKPDLVLWSESALPGPFVKGSMYRDAAAAVAARLRAPLLTGAIGYTASGDPCNTAVLIRPDGSVAGTYQKRTLVPFGEFVPGRHVLPFLNDFGVVEQDEVPGRAYNLIADGSLELGVPICFESASPRAARAFAAQHAGLLAIITNDAWFPAYTGMAEMHLQEARMRAIETEHWVVRAAHTGVSAAISPDGRVQQRLEAGTPGVLVAGVYPWNGLTYFVVFGNWAVTGSAVFAFLSVWAGMVRKTPASAAA